ncbi:MAG: alpha-ketoglutarate-dependent dioxygenase AlkB [Pseudomonadota bacterium]
MQPTLTIRGFDLFKGYLSPDAQRAMVDDIREVLQEAPLVQPVTPSGKPMSVRMSAAGRLGWITDRKGYRYAPLHPNGSPWPAIPCSITTLWTKVTGLTRMPDCCLINWYGEDAKMGMHQDADEGDFSWPVLSISLGDEALFRMGNEERGGKTESVWLSSGDVLVMGGEARLKYHGIDRVKHGSSALLKNGGRINLTLRVVDLPS